MKYFLSLGSNVNAKENLDFAQKELKKILANVKSSSIYKTKAEGFNGDDFLNSVISGECNDSFDELNNKLKSLENAAARDRNAPKFSSRTLDIDIVLQIDEDDDILFESDEIQKYSFVSIPLKEII
ncbi:MAG: 2-amino-4-hydroxy-6-hydroxymethyldihydropteridine diphosphokinase [Gammaproteobacteria bacterium]|mgnify:CR=1 FL=1|nr:2-amino-4-hydroxy-6-hydroxymethyldihydropteridine diphosphokinase [Gammaproteobacteria bacterium]|tara:strand:+ start:932 stop:1309 length:378 start_codon:yes stop_codon:yes gene_type:complete